MAGAAAILANTPIAIVSLVDRQAISALLAGSVAAARGVAERCRHADRALDGAKHGGRNLVVVDGATAA